MTAPDVPAPLKREALHLIREAEAVMADPNRTVEQVDAAYGRLVEMLDRFAPYLEVADEE